MNDTNTARDTAEHQLADLIDRWKIDTYPAADLLPSAEKMPAFLADLDTVLRDLRQTRAGLNHTTASETATQLAAIDDETLARELDWATAMNGIDTLRAHGEYAAADALALVDAQREAHSRKAERLQHALNEDRARNGLHERTIARLRSELEQAKLAPGPTGRSAT